MKRDKQHLKIADMDRRIHFLETEKNLSELEIKELQILKFARDSESDKSSGNKTVFKPKRVSFTIVGLNLFLGSLP